MAHEVGRGGTFTSEVSFIDGGGALVDPVNPLVDVIDTNGTVQATNQVPTRLSLGKYQFQYVVPPTGVLGEWRAHWDATINGVLVAADDFFTVVLAGSIVTDPNQMWITLADAKDLTGDLLLTDDDLNTAAQDLYDYMRWEPVDGEDLVAYTAYVTKQRTALGRAIAWQASYRRNNPISYDTSAITPLIIKESMGTYSVEYDKASYPVDNPEGDVADRARKLLTQHGLLRWSGQVTERRYDDDEIFIRIK